MNRIIINHLNITVEIIDAIKEQYPYGYSDEDMIIFRNARNEIVKAIEVTVNDTDYLIKMSKQMAIHLDNINEGLDEIEDMISGFE